MENATQILTDLLALVAKKRFDLLQGRWGLHEDFEQRIRKCLKIQPKYSEDIAAEVIERLYEAFKDRDLGYSFHTDLWKFIVKMNKNPLPEEIGFYLADYYKIPDVLANSHQSLAVYFKAADNSKYARSRLCIRLFIDDNYSVADFKQYLDKYGKTAALRILQNRQPSSEAKYALFTPSELKELQEDWFYEGLDAKTQKQYRRNNKRNQIMRERSEESKRIREDQEDKDQEGKGKGNND